MPNPWLLLGAAVACLVACFASYQHGVETERGRAARDYQETINYAIEQWDNASERETAQRLDLAVQQERVAGAAREAKLRGQQYAAQNDRPDCRWPERRRVLLNAAVDAANASDDATALGLHAPLPAPAAAGH